MMKQHFMLTNNLGPDLMRNISVDAGMARWHQALDVHLPWYFGPIWAPGDMDAILRERMEKSHINQRDLE